VRAADTPSRVSVQRSGGHAGPMIERLPLSKEGGRAVRGGIRNAARRWYPLHGTSGGSSRPPTKEPPCIAGAMLSSDTHAL
jgi:hypothetical protein